MTFEEEMAAARIRVRQLDEVDGHEDRELNTVWAALEAGLRCPKCGSQYDALVMI